MAGIPRLSVLATLLLGLAASAGARARLEGVADRRTASPPPPALDAVVAGEVVVQLKPRASALEARRALLLVGEGAEVAGAPVDELDPRPMRVRTSLPVAEAVAKLADDPAVLWAEPNVRCRASETANDAGYVDGRLWGMYSDDSPAIAGPPGTVADMGSHAEEAWAAGNVGDRSIVVAVMDEGVAVDHPDLAPNVWTNAFDPPNGRDDDGNGYVDDVHGWDFIDGDATVYDGGPTGTEDRHGTHVAGTIGAVGGNGTYVAGACWKITLLPLKILGPAGGTTLDAAHSLDYLVGLKRMHGLNVVAVNCSWTAEAYSRSLHEAALRAAREGILIVCAAGNNGRDIDATPTWPATFDTTVGTIMQQPASYDAIITVASIDRQGALSSFSNFGAASVDLGAPGSSILSTLPPSGIGTMSGTSMAAPHVSGGIALWAAAHPGASPEELKAAVLGRAVPTGSLAGVTATGSRLDVSSFVPPASDVTVTDVTVPASVPQGFLVAVRVSVANSGSVPVTTVVSLVDVAPTGAAAGVVGAPRSIDLAPGEEVVVSLPWRTADAGGGTHVVRASASTTPGESNVADNALAVSVPVFAVPEAGAMR